MIILALALIVFVAYLVTLVHSPRKISLQFCGFKAIVDFTTNHDSGNA